MPAIRGNEYNAEGRINKNLALSCFNTKTKSEKKHEWIFFYYNIDYGGVYVSNFYFFK